MRRHVTGLIFALMIFSLTICSTRGARVAKRAIDFDEISDFADIIEPLPETNITKSKNSLLGSSNIKRFLPHTYARDLKQYAKDTSISNTIDNSKVTATTSKDVVNKLLNFRMRQFKHTPGIRRRKRLVSMPFSVRGKTYLGNLADETNDLNLKMQNYAATMMVVLTTTRNTPLTNQPKLSGVVAEVKAVETPEKRSELPKKKSIPDLSISEQELDKNLLKVYSNEVSAPVLQAPTSTPTLPAVSPSLLSSSPSSLASSTAISTETAAISLVSTLSSNAGTSPSTMLIGSRVNKSPTPASLTTAQHTTPVLHTETLIPIIPTTIKAATPHIDEDYPLLSADGFYSSYLEEEDRGNQQNYQQKREIDKEDFGLPLTNFEQLLKVVPVNINEDLPHFFEGQGLPLLSTKASSIDMISNMKSLIVTPTIHAPSTTSSVITSTNVPSTSKSTPLTNPYHWENDIIKELNMKYKKEACEDKPVAKNYRSANTSSKFPSKSTTTSGQNAKKLNTHGSTKHKDGRSVETTTGTNEPGPTHPVPLGNGTSANVSICHGKQCEKVYAGHKVYNDTASDCNSEPKMSEAQGGYDIVSNDEDDIDKITTSTELHLCAKPNTSTTTKKPVTCGVEREKSQDACGNGDDDETGDIDPEPCDRPIETPAPEPPPAKGCKKKHKHKPKPPKGGKHKGKRQIISTIPQVFSNSVNPLSLSLLQTQAPLDYQPITQAPQSYQPMWQSVSYVANTNMPRSIVYPVTAITPAPSSLTQIPISLITLSQWTSHNPTPAYQNIPLSSLVPSIQMGHLVKKSIDKNAVSSVIENLKVVDQKLAEAVEPLHSAQELLDTATKCDVTTVACEGHSDNGLLNELSDSERAALQRLAIKIMANQNSTKLKRAGDQEVTISKRGVLSSNTNLPTINDYDYADQVRHSRLQRDLSLVKNIETIVEHLNTNSHKRVKRHFLHMHKPSRKTHLKKDFDDDFGDPGFQEDMYDIHGSSDAKGSKKSSSGLISKRAKSSPESDETTYEQGKKRKSKKIWRKLFGFVGGKSKKHNRFLDQDQQNFQYHHKKKKKS